MSRRVESLTAVNSDRCWKRQPVFSIVFKALSDGIEGNSEVGAGYVESGQSLPGPLRFNRRG